MQRQIAHIALQYRMFFIYLKFYILFSKTYRSRGKFCYIVLMYKYLLKIPILYFGRGIILSGKTNSAKSRVMLQWILTEKIPVLESWHVSVFWYSGTSFPRLMDSDFFEHVVPRVNIAKQRVSVHRFILRCFLHVKVRIFCRLLLLSLRNQHHHGISSSYCGQQWQLV